MNSAQLLNALPNEPEQVRAHLHRRICDAQKALEHLQHPFKLAAIEEIAQSICACFRRGGKVLIAGNGGSLCDAMHMAEELTGYFRRDRPALPAIALSDPGHLSCVANDVGFEWVFARGIEALGKPEDLFIGLSTSGNSPNVVRAFAAASAQKMGTISFLGRSGGALSQVADIELVVEGDFASERIQEAHMTAIHLIIELCELLLFPPSVDAPRA